MLNAMAAHGFSWKLAVVHRSGMAPRTTDGPRDLVQKLTITAPGHSPAEGVFSMSHHNLGRMALIVLTKAFKGHALLQERKDYATKDVSVLAQSLELLEPALHRGLANLTSKGSGGLTYGALPRLASADWDAVLEQVKKVFEATLKSGTPVTRRELALAVQAAVAAAAKGCHDTGAQRTEPEIFALFVLWKGCELVELEAWVQSWTNCVLENLAH